MILSTLVRRQVRVGAAADDGVSLLETVVAMTIASFVFLALAGVLVTGLRASLTGHQAENASDVATAKLEQVRQLPFAAAEMLTTDLTGDPLIQAGNTFDPGTGTAEPLFAGMTGSIDPHISSVCGNGSSPCTGTVYRVGTYITVPTDSGHAAATSYYHRLTVVVTWTSYGQTHSKRASTFLVNTQRGLPLPRFTFRPLGPTSRTLNVGAMPYWAFTVTNLGARDAWNLTTTSAYPWNFYVDTNGDGVHQGSEPLMTAAGGYDYDLNSVIDTGPLETGQSISVVAVRSTALSAAEVGVSTNTFTATSAAQPNAGTASKSITFTKTVTSPVSPTPTPSGTTSPSPTPTPSGTTSPSPTPTPTASPSPAPTPVQGCSGNNCSTFHYYYFHNSAPPTGASTTQTVMRLNENLPTNTSFFDYSTELGMNTYGRYVAPGGSTTSTSSSNVAEWRYQNPINGSMTFAGTATVTVYVRCTANSGPITLDAAIGQATNGTSLSTFTSSATGAAVMTSCSQTTWTPLTIGVTLNNFKVSKGNWLAVRVFDPFGGDSPTRLLYDAAPNYEAVAIMPQVKP